MAEAGRGKSTTNCRVAELRGSLNFACHFQESKPPPSMAPTGPFEDEVTAWCFGRTLVS